LFTSSISAQQTEHLYSLLPRFKHRYVLLDREARALGNSLRMTSNLSCLGLSTKTLPDTVSDPAELDEGQLLAL
jgi:hypothetical protein